MIYQGTLASAAAFGKAGRLEEWVHAYLLSDGHNKDFSDGLRLCKRIYYGPAAMPLHLLRRCCGPEPEMKFRVAAEGFESRVQRLMKAISAGEDMPPLIVYYANHAFELNDGNHRLEAYRRLDSAECACILWFSTQAEYKELRDKYPEIR